jgi:hypothetical protein
MSLSCDLLPSALQLEYEWLQTVYSAINGMSDDVEMNGNYSWAAYNASLQSGKSLDHPDVSVLLPMFRDPAHSPAMICHAMNIIASATRCTNPGQIPVVALDQPLHSLAKQIQWKWPENMVKTNLWLCLALCTLRWLS